MWKKNLAGFLLIKLIPLYVQIKIFIKVNFLNQKIYSVILKVFKI